RKRLQRLGRVGIYRTRDDGGGPGVAAEPPTNRVRSSLIRTTEIIIMTNGQKKIGFIGLGIMGKPMVRNLMKAGYSPVVFNRSSAAVEVLVGEGATAAASAKEVAEKSDVIITMLPDSPDVEAVVLGEGGIIEGVKEGSLLIDMSTISPVVTRT